MASELREDAIYEDMFSQIKPFNSFNVKDYVWHAGWQAYRAIGNKPYFGIEIQLDENLDSWEILLMLKKENE